jgi:hypothetical protein
MFSDYFFIVHHYTHTLHTPERLLLLPDLEFHIASGREGSGQLLNNTIFIKNRTTGSLFTEESSTGKNNHSNIILFTETRGKKGCFSTGKRGYTRALVEKCSTLIPLFHGNFCLSGFQADPQRLNIP